ncbi:protein spaetzle 4 isoform X2 [Solenopsis invicta]|uniref:protein spaetzle 4 isoform X2 n=1 Tax=Solenopsis invicta TaxID=13686 RepID=UPI00193CAEC8|nr:protein spaetzle 4 isoform X2 [Solenopsis invicta]
MKAIAPFVFQVIALQLTRCQSGGGGIGGGGGPSTFGYDASSACSKPYSRTGRTHHEDLPCDFRRQNWCTIAGSSYPWHAVRRFVQENQGLMRRMYGDENYINVLRAELEKNDIELKYDNYHHHFADDLRQFQYDDDYEFIDDRLKVNNGEYEGRGFTSRSFNDPIAKRMNKFSKLSEYTRPHFRPTERTTSLTTTPSSTTTSSTSSSTLTSATILATGSTSSSTIPTSTVTVKNTDEVKTQASVTSTSPKFSNATTKITESNSVINNTTTTTTTTTTSPNITVTQIVKEQNFSINEILEQNERINEDLEKPEIEVVAYSQKTIIEEDTTLELAGTTTDVPIELLVDQKEEDEEVLDAVTKSTYEELIAVASHEQQQQFRPRPEYRPSSVVEASVSTGEQLYQDVAAKDQQEQPVLKFRGMNACPVKEEVVAPFWANNTRGEVLALLNLYPFEQYVHWEKCTHENKQMYCRDGCRCEQQYRLHRLLAYDPNNECRGIFSDWFKFPSCCVCRCYDLPLEFRVTGTSRSPRTSHKRRIKVQSPTRNRYS